MLEMVKEIYFGLKKYCNVFYDEKGVVGCCYWWQDEVGILYCIIVDGQLFSDCIVIVCDWDLFE